MQKPDYEFQLSKNTKLSGAGWRGILAMIILFAGLALVGSSLNGAASILAGMIRLLAMTGAK